MRATKKIAGNEKLSGRAPKGGGTSTGEAAIAERGTRAEIDLGELEKLCMLHCTDQELADWFGVTTRTIERRRREPEFAAVMERGRSKILRNRAGRSST